MTIVDELKKLITARGGSTAGVQTIAEAVRVLAALEAEEESGDNDDQQGGGNDDQQGGGG